MVDRPTGNVTFLFTDIERSTVRWERAPEQMTKALAQHDAILRDVLEQCGGVLCQTAGDSFVVGFVSARPALDMALRAQRALRAATWPAEIGPLRVRMTLHTGTATQRADGYDANHTLTRQARLLATAHAEQILVSGLTRELLADQLPDGVGLRDLGQLWLKDLIDPERVFQVVASEPPWLLPVNFPPLRNQRLPPGNLPTGSLPFIGRERAVDEIAVHVTGGHLTTLLGPGGIGKTRLALQTAKRVEHHFSDGVFFVDLSAVTDVAQVAPTIGAKLGLVESDTAVASLTEHLSDRDLLLVLDNLEQVIDCAPSIGRLLVAAPSLRVLATSRTPLQISGERVYPVQPLDLPPLTSSDSAADDAASFARSGAIALFVERAAAAKPDFALTSANARTVAAICHRLDGIPLALILAAARVRVLTPQMMLDRLDDRLSLLTGGGRDLPTRHQTLRDTIEWSHDLLDDDQQAQYACWSVFVGGFRLEAAHVVDPHAGSDDFVTLDGVAALNENSLLFAVTSADGEMRHRMLETINEHAREKLELRGLTEEVERAHARFFLDLAEEAAIHLEGEELVHWAGRLEEDHDNFRAALSRESERARGGDVESARVVVRMVVALALFWNDRGYLEEGRRHLEGALGLLPTWLSAATEEDDRRQGESAAAIIFDGLGSIARRRGDLAEARRCLEEALRIFGSLDDGRGQGRVLGPLGSVMRDEGDLDAARSAHTRSLELSRAAGDQFNVVNGLLSLGNVERDAGDIDAARSFYEQTLDVAVEIHELIGQSVALNNLANLAAEPEEMEQARELHLRSLQIRHEVGYRIMVAESMIGLAAVEVGLGLPERAARLIGFAEDLAADVGGAFDSEERRLYERTIELIDGEYGTEWLDQQRRVGAAMSMAAALDYANDTDD